MNDKDFNRAILAQLYAKARQLWAESMEFFQFSGSFTAHQLAGALYVHDNYIQAEKDLKLNTAKKKNSAAIKKAKKAIGKWEEAKEVCPIMDSKKKNDIITVSLDTFSCQFPAWRIWKYIYHFEQLAGIGGNVMRFVVPELSEVVATYEVSINKDMAGLAQYCAKHDYRPMLECVALDIDAGRVVATDGSKLRIKPLQVVSKSAAVGECIAIPVKEWQAVCRAAGKGTTLTIQKIQKDGDTHYRYALSDIVGRNYPGRYVNYASVIPMVNAASRVRLGAKDWKAEKKVLSAYKKDGGARLTIMQRAGMLEFIVTDEVSRVVLHTAKYKPEQAAAVDFAEKYLVTPWLLLSSFDIFLPCDSSRAVCALVGCDIVINMPVQLNEEDRDLTSLYNYKTLTGEVNILTELHNLIDMSSINVACEKIGPAVVDVRPAETNNRKEKKKVKVEKVEAEKAVAPSRAKKAAAKKGRFVFAAVGLNVGDELVFVSGAVVSVADGGKVAYKGEIYTLTGFCKKFMPDDRRCKSEAYRGPVYFTRGGVRLDKLKKGAAACAYTVPAGKVGTGASAKSDNTARAGKTGQQKAIEVAPVSAVPVAPAKEVPPFQSVQVVRPVSASVAAVRSSFIGRLRRWAVAVVLLVLVAVGLAAWMQRGTVQDTAPIGVHQPATPAPTAATVTVQNMTNAASTAVIGMAENHRNGGGYPFGATDLGVRSAALHPADEQATNKANNK